MKAGCATQKLQFEAHGKRDVVADFDGGRMTSDGEGLLLRDSLLALLAGRKDLTGQGRKRKRDRAAPLASAATLNRFELGRPETAAQHRYHRMLLDRDGLDNLLVDLFLESQVEAPEEIWLDLDATDDPTQGQQEGRFYHGYYREHCCCFSDYFA